MSLRRRLLLLLLAFATFAVVAAMATIHGVRWQVADALSTFDLTMGQARQIEQLQLGLDQQIFYLRQVLYDEPGAARHYFEARDVFSGRLRQIARFTPDLGEEAQAREILRLADDLEAQADGCLQLAEQGGSAAARDLFATHIEGQLAPALSSKMARAKTLFDESRNRVTRQLGVTTRRTIAMTVVIGCGAALLVLAGVMLIRRWLIAPIAELQAATRQLTAGRFDHLCAVTGPDELGRLGEALNLLARRVSEARSELQDSESKHRSLFRNLRDAVVICDVEGQILEYHDSDSRLLGVEGPEHVGRLLLAVWPEWEAVTSDWPAVLRAAADGKRLHVPAVGLSTEGAQAPEYFADFLVYRIESGASRQVAIVARDVSAWHRLQRRLRQAETMEVVGALAGGLAHDFNNLLTSVAGALNMLGEELRGTDHAERIDTALRACRQAAGLSKRLLNFATSAHGDPQRFRMGEMVEVILNSLDPSFLEGIQVGRELACMLMVRMDRDQFTQVVLNLIRNAREAMPEGGRLQIRVESAVARDPEDSEERSYGVLVVEDSGVGMTPEVRRHIFEPLFTTKSRTGGRGRGLGLAIVYSAVKNAGGFVKLTSAPGQGTTFRIHLPLVEAGAALPAGPSGPDDVPASPQPSTGNVDEESGIGS